MTQGKALTPEQVNRYSRHIIMPQIGSLGQRKLINSKAVVIGAGGLGGPVAVSYTHLTLPTSDLV